MIPSKQKVLEVLKDVVYFPKGSNIVDAEMVKDVEVGENLVRFKLVLDDVDDEKNKFETNQILPHFDVLNHLSVNDVTSFREINHVL